MSQSKTGSIQLRPIDADIENEIGRLSIDGYLDAARLAQENYDFERATTAFRLAIKQSKGRIDTVSAFTAFLEEMLADYEEISELLSSPGIDLDRHLLLKKQYAHAQYHLGFSAAREHYVDILTQEKDALVLSRLAAIELDSGDYLSAQKGLKLSLKLDPTNTEAHALLAECNQRLVQTASTLIQQAEAAFDLGELDEAKRLCESASATHLDNGAAERLLDKIRLLNATSEAQLLIKEAEADAKMKQWRKALKKLNKAHELDLDCIVPTQQLTNKVEMQLASQNFTTHQEVGTARQAQGDYSGALMAYQRAKETGTPWSGEDLGNPLIALLNDTAEQTPTHLNERALEGLAALYSAQEHHGAGRLNDAQQALEEAERHLKNNPAIERFSQTLQSESRQRNQLRVETLLERATALSNNGQFSSALGVLDEVIALDLENAPANALRTQLKDSLEQTERDQKLLTRLERLAEQHDWWRLRQELTDSSEALTPAAHKKLETQVIQGIESTWKVLNLRTQEATVTGAHELPADFSRALKEGVAWAVDSSAGQWIGGAGRLLLICSLPDLKQSRLFELPEQLQIEIGVTRILPSPHGILLFNGKTRELTTLRTNKNGLTVEAHLELGRQIPLPPKSDFNSGVVEAYYCEKSDRLVALVPLEKSRLLSVGVDNGRIHHEERANATLFNLQKVEHDPEGRFTAQSLRNLYSNRPYNFAVIDGRAKVRKRVFYGDLEDPMVAISKVTYFPKVSAQLFCQYSCINPLLSAVMQNWNDSQLAFAQMKNDWDLFYQTNRLDMWLGDHRALCTPFAIHGDSESLIFGWQSTDKQQATGITSLAIERFDRQWDCTLDSEARLENLFEDRPNGQTFALIRRGESLSLHTVDHANRTLKGLA
ncbi:MAG TPA: hypothetical protein EYN06_00510 [Myxococcales bacterium]|nr:hypothetical protein [Myxococcales bacterium]